MCNCYETYFFLTSSLSTHLEHIQSHWRRKQYVVPKYRNTPPPQDAETQNNTNNYIIIVSQLFITRHLTYCSIPAMQLASTVLEHQVWPDSNIVGNVWVPCSALLCYGYNKAHGDQFKSLFFEPSNLSFLFNTAKGSSGGTWKWLCST